MVQKMVVGSFLFFLMLFLSIGVLSVSRSAGTTKDYLLANSAVTPFFAGLSAVATNNSGFMFVGMIGYTYFYGLSSLWLMFGYIAGDYIAALYTHKKIRIMTEKTGSLSYAGVLARWNNADYTLMRFLIGLITLLFLGSYAAAQFQAGSKALYVLFGWNYTTGIILGAVMVFLYCIAGGIRASIWTDIAQSFVMFFAMLILFVNGLYRVGGIDALWQSMQAVGAHYCSVFPHDLYFSGATGNMLFIVGWMFAGAGIIGQPHVLVRFMIVDSPDNIRKARGYYYGWYVMFFALTLGVGLISRLLLPVTEAFDPELALPTLANEMLPDFLVGLVLAGLFAATMSTADSQIISCSAALTRDLFRTKKHSLLYTKTATLTVTIVALIIAVLSIKNVFVLAVVAWSALGSAFGPVLFLYSLNKRVGERTAVCMMFVGMCTSLVWRYLGFSQQVMELAPGMCAGLLTYAIARALMRCDLIKKEG